MQIKTFIKPALPHLLAVAIFLIITLIYFYPVLEGKVLHTNDGTVSKNASKEIRDYREKTGKEPLWTGSMFSGMPAYLISTQFPGNLMKHADTLLKTFRMPVSSIFLTMIGFYILLLIFGVRPPLAIAGAIAYGLSTYFFFILSAGHNTKAFAIAYMAPMIGSFYYAYRRDILKGILLATFFLTLEILANHPQITYYSFICLLIYFVVEFIYSVRQKEIVRFVKRAALLSIPVILAVGMNFGSLYTTYEYGKFSTRGKSDLISDNTNKTSGLNKDYITQWSYGIDETFTLLIPNFKGGAFIPFSRSSETVKVLRLNNAAQAISQFPQYWGTQPWTDGPVYVGAFVIFMFIMGIVLIKGPEKWWLIAATILSVMLAWGKNFMPLTNLFLNWFPGYDKFRAVTTILVIAEFTIPLLALLALKEIFQGKVVKKDFLKAFKIALGITGGLTLLFLLFPGLAGPFVPSGDEGRLPDWLMTAVVSDRKSILRIDAFRSLAFIIIGAVIVYGFYNQKIKKEYAVMLLALLFLTDMFTVDKRYLNSDKFVRPAAADKASAPTVADNLILKDKSIYRVFNLNGPFSDAATSLYHKSIGGYHGAKLRRYNELIDSAMTPEINRFYVIAQNENVKLEDFSSVTQNTNALNMLNAKYIILNPNMPPLANPRALGNAWFADTAVFVESANDELAKIEKFDPSKQAVIDMKFKNQVQKPAYDIAVNDKIELTSYQPNELIYKYSADGERLAVFSEIYYPAGWKAFIDGSEKDYFRTNYVLRGMIVPGGNHEIKFVFKPASYYTGNKISLASSFIFILMVAGYLFYAIKNKKLFVKDDSSQ
jgi:hypothetical protein